MNHLGITDIRSVYTASWGIGPVLVDVGAVVLNQSEPLVCRLLNQLSVVVCQRMSHDFTTLLSKSAERDWNIIPTCAIYLLVYLHKLARWDMSLCPLGDCEDGVRRDGRLVVVVK